jgi:Nif-specific regulatory protein
MGLPVSGERSLLLYELGCAFAGQLDINELLPLILRKSCDALLAEGAAILLLDEQRREFLFRFAADDDRSIADRLVQLHFPADQGIAGAALRARSGIRVDDAATDPRFYPGIDGHTGLHTHTLLAVPLTSRRGPLGVIEVVNRRDAAAFNDDDLAFLTALAGSIALAIDNARLYEQTKTAEERLRAENGFLRATDRPGPLIGDSPPMRRLVEEIRRVAPKDITVLIQGETGTGKELVARSIHAASARRDRLFVAVNCAELSQDAVESRLFGHRKGSFTGASDDHKGFFEVADHGTLFLDEIGELPLAVQGKLLRVLQDGELVRFGDNRPRKVTVRVIAATNRQLEEEVGAGRFREDLFYRLSVITIRVPPLRERREDIPALAEHFLDVHARKLQIPVPSIIPDVSRALASSAFPGNVRDLENTIIRALVMAEHEGVLTLADVRGLISATPQVPEAATHQDDAVGVERGGLLDAVARFERERIERALAEAGGSRTRAAQALRISKRWLLKKLERYETTT